MQNVWFLSALNNIIMEQENQKYFYFHWKLLFIYFIYLFSPTNPQNKGIIFIQKEVAESPGEDSSFLTPFRLMGHDLKWSISAIMYHS